MNNAELTEIASEFQTALIGKRFGHIFPLSKLGLAIDLRLSTGEYLFVSGEPGNPRTYLIRRRLKELVKQSVSPTAFVLGLRKRLSGAVLKEICKLEDERILIFKFETESEIGDLIDVSLVVQLTGRSANIFVVDAEGLILDRLRDTEGQDIASRYSPPERGDRPLKQKADEIAFADGISLSEILDRWNLEKEAADRFRSRAVSARKKIQSEITKKKRLAERLQSDLKEHGNANQWKRFGDLLLANAMNARRDADQITVTDFYDEATPEIAIIGDHNLSISEVAEGYFKRYTKARNAAVEITRRALELERELSKLQQESDRIEEAIAAGDESYLAVEEKQPKGASTKKKRRQSDFNGARKFRSADGYEILVGKKATDNDHLTFRVAKSLDLWLHAADYPGSHVVVRNSDRKDIPHATLVQAAELAAFYSDAREQPKAAVNYTQKKFVNKPKGAAPGLVSLASFKTVLVQPKVGAKKEPL